MDMNEAVTPKAVPVGDYIGDEHWGIGGRYIVDPHTGRRVPAPIEPEPVMPNPSEANPEGAEHDR